MNQPNPKAQGYNERLFSGRGLRSYLHNSRFRWVEATLDRRGLTPQKVIELGCFDGRLLRHLPQEPELYHGFDADWEGGLSKGRAAHADQPHLHFTKSSDPADIAAVTGGPFDLAVALETIEHIDPRQVDAYLAALARHLDGTLLISVPNEKGVVFIAKWLLKKLFFGGAERYTATELANAVLGRLDRVARNEHKGFDHTRLARAVAAHFDDVTVEAIPQRWLPLWCGFTIGIIARSRHEG